VPYSKYRSIHATLCNREEELTLLIAGAVVTLNDFFK
jgi:hypothetical protein